MTSITEVDKEKEGGEWARVFDPILRKKWGKVVSSNWKKKGGGLYIRMEEQHVFPRHSTKQAL